MPTVNYQRDGGNKIVIAAKALIVIVQTFSGVLIQKYGANSAIGLLITAILALAPLLPAADALVVEYGGLNEEIETDPNNVVGIDPSAPPPPLPLPPDEE